MPRQPRLDAPGKLQHVVGLGMEKTEIFKDDEDREDFLSRIGYLSSRASWIVYAWSLLPDHFHLLIRTGDHPLSKNMRKLLTGYAVNFNRRHRRNGQLFQNRYKSFICEDDPYLLELTRYIHLNPVRAGILDSMKSLNTHPWTGHSAILGRVKREWQETDTILGHFGGKGREAVSGYTRFIREGIGQGRKPELLGGGLIRSLGGWPQVVSMRRRGEKVVSDQRILGSGEFVEGLIKEANRRRKETLRLRRKARGLPSLAKQIAKAAGITEAELRSERRTRNISRARRRFSQTAIVELGYPAVQVARFLGVSSSAVVRAVESED